MNMDIEHLSHEIEYRGTEIVQNRSQKRIVLCGLGALGSKLLDLLAVQGYDGLVGIDKDRVEPKNIGTQNYGLADVGRKKAQQSKANTFRRTKVVVEILDVELKAGNVKKLLGSADLVVDLFDNAPSRNIVGDFCRKGEIPCIHAGMAADGFAAVEWNEKYTAYPALEDDGDVPCEYPLAANLVALTVGLTAEIVNLFVDTGVQRSIHFTLKDMHIHVV